MTGCLNFNPHLGERQHSHADQERAEPGRSGGFRVVCAQTRLASQWLLFDSLMPSSDTGACGRALTVVTTAQQPGSGQLPAVPVGADFFSPP